MISDVFPVSVLPARTGTPCPPHGNGGRCTQDPALKHFGLSERQGVRCPGSPVLPGGEQTHRPWPALARPPGCCWGSWVPDVPALSPRARQPGPPPTAQPWSWRPCTLGRGSAPSPRSGPGPHSWSPRRPEPMARSGPASIALLRSHARSAAQHSSCLPCSAVQKVCGYHTVNQMLYF